MPAAGVVSPLRPALAAAVFYVLFSALALALHGGDPLWFVWIGTAYAERQPGGTTGYDGQFVYYIARDGWAALPHLDNPAYRLQRIGYPLLARLLAGAAPAAIPWAMLAINLAAIVATTFLLAGWLARRALSAWYGLVYALSVGVFLSFSRDLTEPLAYALGTAGLLLWLAGRRAAALVLLALAGLTRETTLLLAAGLIPAELARRRYGRALGLAAAALPWLIWQQVLHAVLGDSPLVVAETLHFVPLGGAVANLQLEPGRLTALLVVGLPALLLFAVGARAAWRRPAQPLAWLLLVHSALALLFSDESYMHIMGVGRLSIGLLIAVLLALPAWPPRARLAAALWPTLPTLVWLVPVLSWP